MPRHNIQQPQAHMIVVCIHSERETHAYCGCKCNLHGQELNPGLPRGDRKYYKTVTALALLELWLAMPRCGFQRERVMTGA